MENCKGGGGGGTNINQGTAQPGGVIVYQMTVRYALINGLRVMGGVRVQLDLPKQTGYVQLISLLNEVFLTHYVTSMSFLPPSSAAGVAWSAIPWNNCAENDCCARDACKCKPSVNTKVETAQVIFCDPNHAQRFKTVLDTINSAFATDDYLQPIDPCLPYQLAANSGGTPVGGVTGLINGSCLANAGLEPINLAKSGCPTVCCPFGGTGGVGQGMGQGMGQGDPYSRPGSSIGQPFRDPDDPYAFAAGPLVPGQVSSQIQGADPYLFTADRILFSAPACLVRLEKRKTWREIFRGTLKIIQRATAANFSLLLESAEGNIVSHHFITTNMTFEPSCKTQFGYTFQAASRGMRGGHPCSIGNNQIDDFLISFQTHPHFEQFARVMGEVQRCLSIVSPMDPNYLMGFSDC